MKSGKGLVLWLVLMGMVIFSGCASGTVEQEGTKEGEEIEVEGIEAEEKEEGDEDISMREEASGNETGEMAAPSVTGRLHVEGTQLVGENGKPVQLKGISTHGLAWFPDYVNEDCFRELHEKWRANVVRLAMYTAESGGYCTDGDREYLKGLIRDGVSYAKAQDMYVIVDWHILSDGNPNTYIAEAKEFFAEMSAEYADDEHVLYEICNEPNGGTGWSEIKAYAEEVIGVIRGNDPDAVILVGTPNWSQFVDEAAADPITAYDNLMYTLHFYAATHTDDLRGKLSGAVETGLPVFVSEYGICDASGSGAIDEVQAGLWTELLNGYGISYVAWNLSNKEETSAIIKSSCSKTSGFEDGDLSDSGKWLYQMLTEEGVPLGDNETDKASAASEQGAKENEVIVSGDIEITVKLKNSWEADGKKFYQYDLTLKNLSDKECHGWAVDLPFQNEITLADGWNGKYTAQGSSLHITAEEYNGTIPSGGTVSDVGFIVSGGEWRSDSESH